MLTYEDNTEREAFQAAIERARKNGLSEAEMASMITTAKHDTHQTNGVHPKETDDVIYEPGELPEGLIDLPSASKKYGIRIGTLQAFGSGAGNYHGAVASRRGLLVAVT